MAKNQCDGAARVYETAARFVSDALQSDGSLFTPGKPVWSLENIADLQERYIENPDSSKDKFDIKLQRQLAGAPPETYQLIAELLFVYMIPASKDSWTGQSKRALLEEILSWSALKISIPPDRLKVLDDGIIHGGKSFGMHRYWMLAFLLAFVSKTKHLPDDKRATLFKDAWAFKSFVFSLEAKKAQMQRHILLNLVHPQVFEDTAAKGHKTLIVEQFRQLSPNESDVDRALLEIRRKLTEQHGENFTFYKKELRLKWEPSFYDKTNDKTKPARAKSGSPRRTEAPKPWALDLEALAALTLWPRDRLEEVVDCLEHETPQIVLAGPPGTGKTWVAKLLARFLTSDRPDSVRMVRFHPSYSYEEFIEGLRPVAKNGAIEFAIEDGVVKRIVKDMEQDDQCRVLVIDEMNRANLSRVFGELMYLFEYRGASIELQYSKDFTLPKSLFFVGTMNTADRSIRTIDIALRRRFDVFPCWPDEDILGRYFSSDQHQNDVTNLQEGFRTLNEKLTEQLDRHHTIGHTFFMQEHLTRDRLKGIWERKIGPLIEKYFFDQPDRAREFSLKHFWPES